MTIKGLHHNAYRCRDSEQTRRFYEDFLGLKLAGTLTLPPGKGPFPAVVCIHGGAWAGGS